MLSWQSLKVPIKCLWHLRAFLVLTSWTQQYTEASFRIAHAPGFDPGSCHALEAIVRDFVQMFSSFMDAACYCIMDTTVQVLNRPCNRIWSGQIVYFQGIRSRFRSNVLDICGHCLFLHHGHSNYY